MIAMPARAQPPDLGEQALALACGQRGGRLVEDDDARVGTQRLGDLDQLALALAQAGDRRARGDIEVDRRQQLAARARAPCGGR